MRNLIFAALAFFFSVSLAAAATDYQKTFLNPYKSFITPSEYKEFKKLTTDEEKDKFIADFWTKRNPDCSPEKPLECPTLENKVKSLVDKRLQAIEDDKILVSDPDTFGIRFSTNGGITGDLAHVYLLHGMPGSGDILGWKGKLEGTYFVDMMLWIYLDDRGNEKYRFLFYQKLGVGQYSLFRYLDWTWPPVRALEEISKFGKGDPDQLREVYNELLYTKAPDSYPFLNALMEFSQTGENLDKALDPPTPADLIAKRHDMIIPGTLAKAENLKVPSSSASMIPASLRYYPGSGFRVLGVNSDFDWFEFEDKDKLAAYLMVEANFQDESDPQKDTPSFETYFRVALPKEIIENNPGKGFTFEVPGLNKVVQGLPPGTYLANIYIRNTLHKPKYNHYQETIKK